jgi:phosphatidylglycerophosphatase A
VSPGRLDWRAWRDPEALLACGLGSGFVPGAPGTAGSALAVLIWWFALAPLGLIEQLLFIAALTALGTWVTGRVCRRYGLTDPGAVVIDEFAGQWLVLLAAPPSLPVVLTGFVLFRFFDILKPPPIRQLERRVPGAFGVMLDDLIAGVLGLVVLQFTLWIIGPP